ncbi:MAG: hypothetical protein KF708_07100 [Pirellulales bacterium]|nr:hypothetical protein [Pirellulales bacterium]
MTHFYGIDLGSSSIKGAVLELADERVEQIITRPFPDPLAARHALAFEVDPTDVVTRVREVLETLVARRPHARGVMFCSQMGGLVLTDERARSVLPYLSWRDQRVLVADRVNGSCWFDRFQAGVSTDDRTAIGNELRPGSAVTLLAWLRDHDELPPGPLKAMHLGDYVLAQLTNAPPRTERTLALGTLDLAADRVHHDWLARLGLSDIAWPELVTVTTSVGTVRCGDETLPCYPAVGDQQAALLGAELVAGELSVNVSTGAQVSTLTGTPQLGDYQTRPYLGGRYLNTVTHLPGGRGLNVLIELLSALAEGERVELNDPWGTIARAVEDESSGELEVDLSFFAGAAESGGYVRGMRGDQITLGALFRGAFRHMADQYEQAARRLLATTACRGIVISGGLPQRMPRLRRMIVERFAWPDRMATPTEETLTGLLRLAREIERQTHTL